MAVADFDIHRDGLAFLPADRGERNGHGRIRGEGCGQEHREGEDGAEERRQLFNKFQFHL